MLPSIVLGYLSWRMLRDEQAYSLERLRASYRQLADLAARQLDYELRSVESRWNAEFDALLNVSRGRPTPEQVAEHSGREPLIAGYFLLNASGRVLYPPLSVSENDTRPEGRTPFDPGEHERFALLVARGEAVEYETGDPAGASRIYREILARVTEPRLLAMAESHLGRAQLKAGDHAGALSTYRRLLGRYPEIRDQNRMYLRFLARYQSAVALEALRRYREALETLLELNRDLLSRSETITTEQYAYYSDLIRALAPRLLGIPGLEDRERYAEEFRVLGEQSKSRIGSRYFVNLLDAELNEMSFKRKRFLPRTRYLSARAEGDPFLIAYRALPDDQHVFAAGILAARIDLERLQDRLMAGVRQLRSEAATTVAVLEPGGATVLGADSTSGALMATQNLAPPFEFWQVGVFVHDLPGAMKRQDLRRTLWFWVVSLMLLSILFGGYVSIVRARRAAYLARAQTSFVSNVTHELRAPLTSIRMFAELMEIQVTQTQGRKGLRFDENAAEYLGVIRRECDRLGRLIDRVIDFARVERKVRAYRFEAHDVGSVVTAAVELFRPNAQAHGFSLDLSVTPSLPPVRLDADAISQVLLNLLSNAVRYSEDEKAIRVGVGRQGASLVITVSDRGIGIPPRDLRRVFDRFYSSWRRMDAATQGGLGLGLTLSREIVRAHGGEIWVESEVGRGSTFTVALPLPASTGPSVEPPLPAPPVRLAERLGGP